MRIYAALLLLLMISQASFSEGQDPNLTFFAREAQIKTFRCTKCHHAYLPGNFEKKNPKDHAEISYKHMPDIAKCTLCHSTQQPDMLNLQDGTLLSYNENPKLCGQCHGKIVYQWELGRHGKDVGFWNGKRTRWTCTQCHNPHSPKFKPVEAVAQPYESPYIIKKGKEAHE